MFYSFACLPAVGLAYEYLASRNAEKKFLPPGELIDVGGYRLHINCQGDKKADVPAVIFESGIWCCSLDWQLIQPEIAKITQTISYDRAGYGWSEEGPRPRTFEQNVQELKILLNKKGIHPPYIMVGHSSGGSIVLQYQRSYPEDVAGLILVDTLVEQPKLSGLARLINTLATRCLGYLSYVGVLRCLTKLSSPISLNPGWTPEKQNIYLSAHRLKPRSFFTYLEEWDGFESSFEALNKESADVKEKPITVICRGNETPLIPWLSKERNDEMYKHHFELQKRLLHRSKFSELRIAKNSGHMIQLDKPEAIIEAVQNMIQKEATNFSA